MVRENYETYNGKPVNCFKCGAKIGFHQLKSGKWMKVDLWRIDGEWCYQTGMGNHGNFTARHTCLRDAPPQKEPTNEEIIESMKSAGIYEKYLRDLETVKEIAKNENDQVLISMLSDISFQQSFMKNMLAKLNRG
jgi:hypothetical protein